MAAAFVLAGVCATLGGGLLALWGWPLSPLLVAGRSCGGWCWPPPSDRWGFARGIVNTHTLAGFLL